MRHSSTLKIVTSCNTLSFSRNKIIQRKLKNFFLFLKWLLFAFKVAVKYEKYKKETKETHNPSRGEWSRTQNLLLSSTE